MKTILIVDDDPEILDQLSQAIRGLLQEKGYKQINILTTGLVQEAIGILNTEAVELLITDYRTPDLNGLQLIRFFQSRIEIRKVLMTLDALLIEDLIQAAREGVDAILPKPVSVEKLRQILDNFF